VSLSASASVASPEELPATQSVTETADVVLVGRGGATGRDGGARAPRRGGFTPLPPVGEFKDLCRGWVGYDFH